jgi:hypothetical protein
LKIFDFRQQQLKDQGLNRRTKRTDYVLNIQSRWISTQSTEEMPNGNASLEMRRGFASPENILGNTL